MQIPETPRRRSIRLSGYDFSQNGAYFITICTQNRECLFGEIENGEMRLNDTGRIVSEEWMKTAVIRDEIELDICVVMPNHFHGIEAVAAFCLGKMLDQKKNRGEPLPYLANVNVRWGEFDLTSLRELLFEEHELDRYGLKYGDIVMREGLDEESLALFDLLHKPKLSAQDIKRIKSVAVDLLQTVKNRISVIEDWESREATRDNIRLTIRDFLWSDITGLPADHYSEDDVLVRAEEVYRHVFRVYPTLPSPFYEAQAA